MGRPGRYHLPILNFQKHNRRLTIQKKIDKVANKINAAPVKCLSFKTPAGVFAKCGGVVLVS
jgi:IS30 family transposase